MYCTRCGTKVADDAKFCTECGSPVELRDMNYGAQYGNGAYNRRGYVSEKKEKKQEGVLIAVIAAVVIAVAVIATAAITSMSLKIKNSDMTSGGGNGGKTAELEKRPVISPTPTPTPSPTPFADLSYTDISGYSAGYNAVRDNVYSFICPYPDYFNLTRTYNGYSLSNGADSIRIDIEGYSNIMAMNGKELLEQYMAEINSDAVSYSASGESWYAISFKSGNNICYRKCIVNDLNVAYFDVACNKADLDATSGYIDYMESKFKFE